MGTPDLDLTIVEISNSQWCNIHLGTPDLDVAIVENRKQCDLQQSCVSITQFLHRWFSTWLLVVKITQLLLSCFWLTPYSSRIMEVKVNLTWYSLLSQHYRAHQLCNLWYSRGPSSKNPLNGKAYGTHFPMVSIKDMIESQRLLLADLCIEKVNRCCCLRVQRDVWWLQRSVHFAFL